MTIIGEFGRQVGPLRRALLRATRAADGLPDLPEAHIEVLRALTGQDGLSTVEVAERLRLARPTVSNLLGAMERGGLVELIRDGTDRRRVTIKISAYAADLLIRYDTACENALAEAVARLGADDRAALERIVPVLPQLTELLCDPCEPGSAR
ncbi:DNA-binding MarR family transcriptional regulator [Actinoplanes lutulentus]|uniref:DNA-binding MarR family transcriptional regulator n=1 Tax=Actinoplanes lutulentus TaxID=1287878 RepID=A0A327Z1P6_9ACTN|nr:MarR family winged helix-turn-helix transcriptional regulator [Actinoplanes lutulentus]MBB2947637.1 DNA-binding MarR family transcriptional regulator [Actinoplanes lutulentus]RAK27694.1 DNA-binding MarR family transcriptional regulator [Actinoplanes lutulentus]